MWSRERAWRVRTDLKLHPPMSVEPAEDADDLGTWATWPPLFANQSPGQPEGCLEELRSVLSPSGWEGCSHPRLCRGMPLLHPPAHLGLVAVALGGSSQAHAATCFSTPNQGESPPCV